MRGQFEKTALMKIRTLITLDQRARALPLRHNYFFLPQDHLPPSPEVVESPEVSDAKFEFTKVECLLFAFHSVAKQDQKFLNENPEVFKDFKVVLLSNPVALIPGVAIACF